MEVERAGENDISDSSLQAEANNSDSKEQLINFEKENEKASSEVKERRINRRIALAMARAQESSPHSSSPSLGKSLANKTIDLTVEDDDPTQKWFKKTFKVVSTTKKVIPKKGEFQAPHNIPANAPRSLSVSSILKKKLEADLAVKRMRGLQKRREMYEMDNQHLRPDSEEEEEEEEVVKTRKKKTVKHDEYDSEDDSDYDPNKNSDEDEADDESNKQIGMDGCRIPADDEVSVNLLNDSFTYDVFNAVRHRPGPGSTISTLDGNIEKNGIIKMNVEAMEASIAKPFNDEDFGDILDLCSGTFGSQFNTQIASCSNENIVEDENILETEEKELTTPITPVKHSTPVEDDDDDDDIIIPKSQKKQKRHVVDSDNEDEIAEEVSETVPETVEEPVEETVEVVVNTTKRIVVSDDSSDSETEQDDEEKGGDEGENHGEAEEPEEEEEEVEEPEEEEDDEPAPNFDDEDDELAVLKRIEYQEYKTKSKKKNFFDDEASLSGDDIGSDVEDDDPENDYYEAEEGDADDLPDNDTIRKQNHRLMMKQENDKEQRALLKLQDRLLADGDLGGVETNRQFRFRLREETDAKIGDDLADIGGGENNEQEEEEEGEEDEAKKAERAQILKFRIEKAEELMMLDEPMGINDPFARAAKIVKSTKVQIEVETGMEIKKPVRRIEKPSLLKKTTLATTMQEVLVQSTSAAPKQMYVQNYEPSENRNQKRQLLKTTPDTSIAKRLKPSKLSILE